MCVMGSSGTDDIDLISLVLDKLSQMYLKQFDFKEGSEAVWPVLGKKNGH